MSSDTNHIINFETVGVINESNLPKVPEGWQVFWSTEQRKPFYVPPNNNQSQWDHPNKLYAWKLYRDNNNGHYFYNILTHESKEINEEDIENPYYYWKKILNKQTGKEYYYNTVTQQTQWEVPFQQPLDTRHNAHYQRQLSTPTLQPPPEEVKGQVEEDLLRAESAQTPNVQGEVYTVESKRGKPRGLAETADQRGEENRIESEYDIAKNLLESEEDERITFLNNGENLENLEEFKLKNKERVLLNTWGIGIRQSSHSSVVKTFIGAIRVNNRGVFDSIYNKYSKKVCGGYVDKRHSCIQDIINPSFMEEEIGKNDKGEVTINGKPLMRFRIIIDKEKE